MSRFRIKLSGDFFDWVENYPNESLNKMERVCSRTIAPMLQQYAQTNAPWTDRTGNARRGLHSQYNRRTRTSFVMSLSHGVDYGIFLELCNSGRFAILMPTVEALMPQILEEIGNVWGS